MNIKSQKGITLVMLVITIIVIIIIAGITVSVGGNIIEKAKFQNLNTNMLLIQAKTKSISEDSKFSKDTSKLIGQKVSEISGDPKIEKLRSKNAIEDLDQYYMLSQEDLNSIGLEKITIDDGYLVNYDTEEIVYVKGIKANKNTYYRLSETKDLEIK